MPAELESVEFADAAQVLATAQAQVQELMAAQQDEQLRIGQLTEAAGRLQKPLVSLNKAVRTIRFIAVNARIVATGIQQQNADFDSSAMDMAGLGRSVERAVTAFARSYQNLMSSLSTLRAANRDFTARHGNTMQHVSERLSSHLEAVDRSRSDVAASKTQHMELIGQIRQRVASAVSALQIGDITRQRVEHVEEALGLLAEHTECCASPEGKGADLCTVVCRLQGAQLDEAICDLDSQVGQLADSLRGLAEDAEAVLRQNSERTRGLVSAGGAALTALAGSLRELTALIGEYQNTRIELRGVCRDVAHSVTGMVRAMTDHLDDIGRTERQIRLLSFNTAIQCGELGAEGSALQVIAHDLRELAGEAVGAAEGIMNGLHDAEEVARLLLENRSSAEAERMAVLRDQASAAVAMFEEVAERLRGRAATMAESGPKAVDLLRDTAKQVTGHEDFCDVWRHCRDELMALGPGAHVVYLGNVDDEFLSRLRAGYTMDSERHLHDRLFGHQSEESIAGSSESESGDLDEFFF